MRLGYSRPLEATDLYKLQDDRSSGVIAEKIIRSFEARKTKADEYNTRLANGEISPGLKGIWWSVRGQRQEREKEWREKTGKKKPSFAMAVNDSVFWFFWSAGILRLISDVALITSPLLVKVSPISYPCFHRILHLLLGYHQVCRTFVCRSSHWTGSPSSRPGCRLCDWPFLLANPVVFGYEPLFLPIHGYWCLATRGFDHRDLQQGPYALHSRPLRSSQRKAG